MRCPQCAELGQQCPSHNIVNAQNAARAAGVPLRTFYSWRVTPIAMTDGRRYWLEVDVLNAERDHRNQDRAQQRARRVAS